MNMSNGFLSVDLLRPEQREEAIRIRAALGESGALIGALLSERANEIRPVILRAGKNTLVPEARSTIRPWT